MKYLPDKIVKAMDDCGPCQDSATLKTPLPSMPASMPSMPMMPKGTKWPAGKPQQQRKK